MNLTKHTVVAFLMMLGMSVSASATTLNVSNGILMGASDVNVGGDLYDVVFKDGIIKESVNAFTTVTLATVASQALLDQVLTGIYDSNPEKTNGCTSTTACFIVTAYGSSSQTSIAGSRVTNYSGSAQDAIDNLSYTSTANTASYGSYTLAIWTKKATTPAATAVPEPEAYAMMLAGLGLVGFAARRKKQTA